MYALFTDRARKAMQLANQEAQRLNHEYIGTEHILLGIIKEGSGVAAKVLKNLDIDLRKIRLEVEKIVQSGPDRVTMGKLPQTPRAKMVVAYAVEESKNFNHNYVGTEHLLAGLLREEEGTASQVLRNLGVKLEDVREEVLYLLSLGCNAAAEESYGRNLVRRWSKEPKGRDKPAQEHCGGPAEKEETLSAERERIRSLDQQLWYTRIVLGVFAGGLISALVGGSLAAAPFGLILGGLLPFIGRRLPGALAGCVTGLLVGSFQLRGEDGGLAGTLLGVLVGTLIAVSFTSPKRYAQSILTAAVIGRVIDSPLPYPTPGCCLFGTLMGGVLGIAIGEIEESVRWRYFGRCGRR
jgi:hypothetical protein